MKERMRKIGNGAKVAGKATWSGIKTGSKKTWSGVKATTQETGEILREAAPGLVVAAAFGGILVVLKRNGEEVAEAIARSFVA